MKKGIRITLKALGAFLLFLILFGGGIAYWFGLYSFVFGGRRLTLHGSLNGDEINLATKEVSSDFDLYALKIHARGFKIVLDAVLARADFGVGRYEVAPRYFGNKNVRIRINGVVADTGFFNVNKYTSNKISAEFYLEFMSDSLKGFVSGEFMTGLLNIKRIESVRRLIIDHWRVRVHNAQSIPDFIIDSDEPEKACLRFIITGDLGYKNRSQGNLIQHMAEKAKRDGLDFMLIVGDNFYPIGVLSPEDTQFEEIFEKPFQNEIFQIPFYVALGNHDYLGNPDAQVDYTRRSKRWKMASRYYTFTKRLSDSTTVQFFALDTTPIAWGMREFQKQLEWFEHELQESKARWKIIFGHHPVYSNGEHGDTPGMLKYVRPLLGKYKADLYVAGHDHTLQLLKSNDGVYYVVSGAGSDRPHSVWWRDNTLFAATNRGFVWFCLSDSKLNLQFINRRGEIIYAYAIEKNDKLINSKTGSDLAKIR